MVASFQYRNSFAATWEVQLARGNKNSSGKLFSKETLTSKQSLRFLYCYQFRILIYFLFTQPPILLHPVCTMFVWRSVFLSEYTMYFTYLFFSEYLNPNIILYGNDWYKEAKSRYFWKHNVSACLRSVIRQQIILFKC